MSEGNEEMIDKVKKKILLILDLESDELPQGVYIAAPLIGILFSKYMGYNNTIMLVICLDVLLALITIIEIARVNKNVKKIFIYLGLTVFCVFMTLGVWLMKYYTGIGNIEMFSNVLKIFLFIVALVMNIASIAILKNRRNTRGRKIVAIVGIILFSTIAVLGIVFLPPKGM